MATLLTLGHGTAPAAHVVELLAGAGVRALVDVRTHPGSRRNPQFRREAMEAWLPGAGVTYRWEPRLGGRRRALPASRHVALRDPAFRGYADHMESESFAAALDELLAGCAREPTTVMCAESVWWRCHRRLLADAAVLTRDAEVLHLFHDGRLRPHPVTDGARVEDGVVVYDVVASPPLFDLG